MKPTKEFLALVCAALVFLDATNTEAKSDTERAGDILQIVIPAAAFGTELYLHDGRGQRQFLKSFLADIGIAYTLKYTVHKERPEHKGDHAFPSGHTAAAFQGASFIQKRFGWRYGIPAYVGAAFVGWSRVEGESDEHDATDVVAGAAIGTLCTYFFTTSYQERGVGIAPAVGDGTYGLCIGARW